MWQDAPTALPSLNVKNTDFYMTEFTSLARLLIDCAMAILIWLVQCVIYPAYHHIDRTHFSDWHQNYMGIISLFVMPLMLTQAALITIQCFQRSSGWAYASALAMLLAWTVTFLYSVPCHTLLQQHGYDAETTQRLIQTNWFRTIAWTAVLLFALLAYRKTA